MADNSKAHIAFEKARAEFANFREPIISFVVAVIFVLAVLLFGEKTNPVLATIISLFIGVVSFFAILFLAHYLPELWSGETKIAVIAWVILVAIYIPILVLLFRNSGTTRAQATEISNVLITQTSLVEAMANLRATPAIFYAQTNLTLRKDASIFAEEEGIVPKCTLLENQYKEPVRGSENDWLLVYSQALGKLGYVPQDTETMLSQFGVCPTPTLTSTVTLTPTVTLTRTAIPTRTNTPTVTSTQTLEELAIETLLTYFSLIEIGDTESLNAAWGIIHKSLQKEWELSSGGFDGWKQFVTLNTFDYDEDDIRKRIDTRGHAAQISIFEYAVIPDESPPTPYPKATFCLVYNIDDGKWYIRHLYPEGGSCW